MKVNASARCIGCENSLGKPIEIVEREEEKFTLYECVNCTVSWLRPHNP